MTDLPQMTLPQPWLADAMEQLDLRKRDRCLVLGCPTPAHVAAVSAAVGSTATIVVVEPDAELAQRAARGGHERIEVLAHTPDGRESFGTFDALLACPLTTMDWSINLWAELIVRNLRPGGRFVLDLPAENMCEPLTRAWQEIGGNPDALRLITGPTESELTTTLRQRGLRNVEASMGTHLASLENPYMLAKLLLSLDSDGSLQSDLELKLVESLQTNSEVDVVFHRSRVHGLR